MKDIVMKYFFVIALLCCGCGKAFLDEKPNKRTRVPNTLEDYGALLDNTNMNEGSAHALGMIGGDEYYLTDIQYNTFPDRSNVQSDKNAYTWNDIIYQGGDGRDWGQGFSKILVCNVVFDGLQSLNIDQNLDEFRRIKGTAHFFRALNYYNLAQLFCDPYSTENLHKMGLPIRQEADVTVKADRSSLDETYSFILSDMEEAAKLLPDKALTIFRPDKTTVEALKVRLFLQQGDYQNALLSCNRVLENHSLLLDFNGLDIESGFTFNVNGEGNPEIIFYTTGILPTILANNAYNVDTALVSSYSASDLRGQIYFKDNQNDINMFMGSYSGSLRYFTGFATDEFVLHRAECYARLDQPDLALEALNKLRRNRFSKDQYTSLESSDTDQILSWILEEKRKELVLRGVRWEELRRLNKEDRFKTTLTRKVGDQVYELPPQSKKWVWPLPLEAIQIGGYKQNDR